MGVAINKCTLNLKPELNHFSNLASATPQEYVVSFYPFWVIHIFFYQYNGASTRVGQQQMISGCSTWMFDRFNTPGIKRQAMF